MNELIQNLISKVGISEDQAKGAVATVGEFIKGKIPESFHGQIDAVLGGIDGEGEEGGGNPLDAAKDMLGNMFGGKD